MTDLEAIVALNKLDIGYQRLKRLLQYFASLAKILEAPYAKLLSIEGIGEKLASRISSFKSQDLQEEFEQIKKLKIRLLTFQDAEYPQNLKQIYDPPIVLYVKGRFTEADKQAVAVVGSRHASLYGLNCAEKFATQLAELGLTVVSGMARGIDTASHRGALKAGGRTIAVLGSGLGFIYPEENIDLAEKIAEQGAVISEFPIFTQPRPQNFPRRNRIISGLALGVLVVEAAHNSGALITADFALEQGKEVFALPGKIDSPNAQGTNYLIKQGAKLVCTIEDILEELNIQIRPIQDNSPLPKQDNCLVSSLTQEEQRVYQEISEAPKSADEIWQATRMHIPLLMSILMKLAMKKLIRQLPGKIFMKGQ